MSDLKLKIRRQGFRLEDNASSADNAALPARLARLTPADQLDSAVLELGPAAVRPILEEGGESFLEAAAERREDGPWWRLLSDTLDELSAHNVRHGWETLFHSIKQAEALEPPQLDHLVCTVDSLLRNDTSSDD